MTTNDKPTLDPATLAAVRDAVIGYRGAVSDGVSGVVAYDIARADFARLIKDMMKALPSPAVDRPPLTAAEVRRIAREVFAEEGLAKAVPLPTTPPSPPAPERVEAWLEVDQDGRFVSAHMTPPPLILNTHRLIYVAEHPGVTDAASAEAFARAVREAYSLASIMRSPGVKQTLEALAPFLPDAPR